MEAFAERARRELLATGALRRSCSTDNAVTAKDVGDASARWRA
jgi:hypothetical protein